MMVTGALLIIVSVVGIVLALMYAAVTGDVSALVWVSANTGTLLGGMVVVSLQQIRDVLVELRDAGVDALEADTSEE